MGNSKNGFEYEGVVLDAIRRAGFAGNISEGAGASAAAADADFFFRGKAYPVEVKLDSKAQMGGSSVRFTLSGPGGRALKTLNPSLVKPNGIPVDNILLDEVRKLHKPLRSMLRRISELSQKDCIKFPVQCSKEIWTQVQDEGLLVNTKIQTSVDFITNHYESKGVHYIQFGDAGLFYLTNNVANLPVPKLSGGVHLEVRTARGGSKPCKDGGRAVTGAIRVQGRLKLGVRLSPYTLDNPDSIIKMFKEIS